MPPNVIKMQMRIDDVINLTWCRAGRLESGNEVCVQVVPPWDCRPPLPIADTRIDHDRVVGDEYHKRLNQSARTPCIINEVRPQPRVL
jgi:hypothetical protein